jgi:uncharacterized protein
MAQTRGTALVTGASSGIGAEFARQLAREGYGLILHGRRTTALEKLRGEILAETGIAATTLVADLVTDEGMQRVEDAIRATPELTLLVNNAGFSSVKVFAEEEIEGQEGIIRVHVLAAVRCTHAALQVMRKRNAGGIINVSSVAGFFLGPGSATYCATKTYMTAFTETLHLELKDSGIRVQALCPGFTVTDFHRRLGYDTGSDFFKDFMSAEFVVRTSLRDFRKGKVVSVPGWKYRVLINTPRFLPRRLYYALVTWVRRSQRLRGGAPIAGLEKG